MSGKKTHWMCLLVERGLAGEPPEGTGHYYVRVGVCQWPAGGQARHGRGGGCRASRFEAILCAYVSRGGLKLEKAMETFPITLDGAVCGDIGASTGGFTDCMLQNGAKPGSTRWTWAMDSWPGSCARDPRVVCLERTNARYLTHEQIPEELDFASVDVSFISLKLILPALHDLLRDGRPCGLPGEAPV